MDQGNDQRSQNKVSFFKKFTRFWGAIFTLLSALFLSTLFYLDILPLNYTIYAFLAIAFLWLIIFPALFIIRIKKSRKLIALFFSLIIMVGYGIGISYLHGTANFLSGITSFASQTRDFYVIAEKNDSKYNKLTDISGAKVFGVNDGQEGLKEAFNKIKDRYSASAGYYEDISSLGDGLLNRDCRLILFSERDKSAMQQISPDFKSRTKVIGKIRIKIKDKAIAKRKNLKTDSYNVLISGIDHDKNIDEEGRSDVNMLVTVNPKTKNVLLTSIPRDYRVKLKKFGNAEDKITHTGLYGADCTVDAVEELLDVDVNYYVKVNFATVRELVDAIGGIDVYSDKEISLDVGGGRIHKYIQGINHVSGEEALAFARERDSYESGDIHRNMNQQAVMKAIIEKATSSTTILNKYGDILSGLQGYIRTNFSETEIKTIIKNELKNMGGWKITSQNITGEGNSDVVYSSPQAYVYIMEHDDESIENSRRRILRVQKDSK